MGGLSRVTCIAEQLTVYGSPEYVVFFAGGKSYIFQDYPTDDDLEDPTQRGKPAWLSS